MTKKPRAWEDFVDRFMGLVIHVINHTAHCRSVLLASTDRDDLVGDVMLQFVENDFAVLRHFRGQSSLATYLTVISRRVVVKKLIERHQATSLGSLAGEPHSNDASVEQRIEDREEVDRLLQSLGGTEAQVVRLYHLEGKTYQEISRTTGMSTNSVGPMLSRVRSKLRGMPQA
ncbi:sigma-70 family RNA polymerase sigma factor [Bythopirellula polymerisocia]|uniref:sigma-70 family RNA polymerase sigma factor n=1 Tax=Bythopirellula polymerisocia TaxID=2528003 RepID=UPI001E5CC0C6|nr:sigma-70 family RNA polymerase sigma factor [Bythopirellula polymerisocia]